jgi:hypothetical protein
LHIGSKYFQDAKNGPKEITIRKYSPSLKLFFWLKRDLGLESLSISKGVFKILEELLEPTRVVEVIGSALYLCKNLRRMKSAPHPFYIQNL